MKKLIDSLSRKKLEVLYAELLASGENPELRDYIGNRLTRINEINRDFVNYSSSRMVEHSLEDEERCLEIFKVFCVFDFPFLMQSICGNANRIGAFMYDGELFNPNVMTLAQLDEFFKDDSNIYNYEGTYNTLNFIRNRFYSVEDAFRDYREKREICRLNLGSIASYIFEIKSGTKLKLSIGDKGLVGTMNGTYKSNPPYQQVMVDAFAFGSDLEKLESGNYEDCKRLLYLPRNVINK